MKEKKVGRYIAYVEVHIGLRFINSFMRGADLGMTGVFVKEIARVEYKEGEEVDEERVNQAFIKMKQLSDAENTEIEISSHKIISIERRNDG